MNQKLLSIGKAADLLGVHINTLRTWDEEGKLEAVKTCGNHRRYRLTDIQKLCGEYQKTEKERYNSSSQLLQSQFSRTKAEGRPRTTERASPDLLCETRIPCCKIV